MIYFHHLLIFNVRVHSLGFWHLIFHRVHFTHSIIFYSPENSFSVYHDSRTPNHEIGSLLVRPWEKFKNLRDSRQNWDSWQVCAWPRCTLQNAFFNPHGLRCTEKSLCHIAMVAELNGSQQTVVLKLWQKRKNIHMYVWLSGTWLLSEANQKILKLPDDSGRNRGLEIMDELFQSNFGAKAESNSNLIPEKHKFAKVCVKAL